jgi:hypothetical protein
MRLVLKLSIITKQQDDKTTLRASYLSPSISTIDDSYEYNIVELTTNGIVITNDIWFVEQCKEKLKS